ncbi:hypothetical protein [Catenuloplanes atrovinosus]|uniref:Uncharacterized protein n=1 Tax=Catenuloplanes atrovinosus TaxID=137266 RepID=A0AAE3YKG9_9ACTN|nr:hypothetical protein [Catenuloplanes atrovinosus]MDR7273471.1 hypothetical protein [Catenuloplanes atrovinosus]
MDPGARAVSRRAVALIAAAVVAVLAGGLAVIVLVNRPDDDPPPQPVIAGGSTVTVDAARDLGPFGNPAGFQNQSGPEEPLGSADLDRVARLEPQVVRAWFKPHMYYDHEATTFDFDFATGNGDSAYDYYDQVAAQGESIIGNFDQCDQVLMRLDRTEDCRWVLKAGLLHYKKRYPSLRYIEVFNEPDKTWKPSAIEQPAMSLDDYYRWYQVAYRVVNEVNDELAPDVPLEIGGPSSYTFNEDFLTGFLDRYVRDGDPDKRFAFISYHQYAQRERPATVAREREIVRGWMRERKLDEDRPVFVTEYGIFPGANTGTTFEADLLTHAAGMATLGRYYAYSGTDMYLHWVYDHLENERKSMFVDDVDGGVYPYYNLVLMQRMLATRLVPAESDAVTDTGIGVSAVATTEDRKVAVLLTNYQWTTGAAEHDVTLALRNLPATLTAGEVTVERYLVDARTSNRTSNPLGQDLQRVERYDTRLTASADLGLHLGVNAMSLVVITPKGAR